MARSISQEKVWMKYFVPEAQREELPKCTAYQYLKKESADRLNLIALNYIGNRISYKKFFERIEESANAFYGLGVKPGEKVSFLSVAVPECITALYALNKIGATANMIDPRMDTETICREIIESGSRFLVAIDVTYAKLRMIMNEINQEKIIILSVSRSMSLVSKTLFKLVSNARVPYSEKIITYDDFLKYGDGKMAVEAPYVGDHTFAIAYTGGTTGFPKGVMLTNDGINSVAYNFKYSGLKQKPGEKFLGIIPVFTSYGMVCGMHMPICLGLELIPVVKFDPAKFGALVMEYRPNHMISTPAFYEMLMESEEVKGKDLSFVITMGSGGDTMNEGLEKKLHNFMKRHNIKYPLAQGYGMSELSAAASFCVNEIYKSGSVGIPSVTTTVSIFDTETGEELSYGEVGEICITGPSMMKGYDNRPDETANIMRTHSDGNVWIHSGDIGYMDEDGFLFVKGRVKRMITRFDGHKVFPVTIESFVTKNDEVRNCSVIGVNDLKHGQGQYPIVIVELDETIKEVEPVLKRIYDDCQTFLEERGRPVGVYAIKEIPLTGSGKNDYVELEKIYQDADYQTTPIKNDIIA